MQYKLLAVDDEEYILKLLKDYFTMQGYLVYTAKNGVEAMEKLEVAPDLILLDVNMPDMDGMEVCRRIRRHVSCPIVFLTAKVEERDRINGLVSGGDDYILKPFSIDELGARVAAHLRREERGNVRETVKFSGELVINYSDRTVCWQEQSLSLTRTEFDLVEILSTNRGQILAKKSCMRSLEDMTERATAAPLRSIYAE